MVQTSLTRSSRPNPGRILIAEDDTFVRDFLEEVLQWSGYTTVRAVDGRDALEMADQLEPFDLLLTDEIMPGMMGHELAEALRKQEPNLKVLYLTGHRDRLMKEKGAALQEYEAVLEKPSTAEALLAAVSALLFDRR